MSSTGILTDRCDPYGAESQIQLAGGVFDPSQAGKYHWYCQERAVGRYRMICAGGQYGSRIAPDGGTVAGYSCDGGHRGQVMPLCKIHVRQFSSGPRAPGFDASGRPHGIVGGTKVNEMCPACMWPAEARELQATADRLHMEISQFQVGGLGLVVPGRLLRAQNDVTERLNELNATGLVHKCPLILREVS